ncbi:SH3BP5 [Branchiostoma lanceolatum]|uniref:SH3BP5 protein n=1 Tax=Branchiostoma lanceolatum TaxID=7740 RepID=A0A8J9YMR3_BRALA|nr:SH3BP5 [Branchiostoma lanceolatum]
MLSLIIILGAVLQWVQKKVNTPEADIRPSLETVVGLCEVTKEELERLNAASNEINKLEAELDEARALFRQTLTESTQKLNLLSKKMGKSVQKARPYYDAKKMAKQAQIEAQKAAVEYQRANGIHRAARETISLAEQRLFSDADEKRQFDSAWQEMLNHATMKVMEAEQMRSKSEHDHQQKAEAYTTANQKLQQLEKSLKKVITKTKPYFDVKNSFELQLLQQKQNVEDLQKAVSASKVKYREALKNLESISDEIHRNRQLLKEPRSAGVGAEAERDDLPEINLDDVDSCSQFSDLDDGNSLDTDSTTDDASMVAQTDTASLARRERGGSFTSHSSENFSLSSQDVAEKTSEGGLVTEGTATCTTGSVQAVEGVSVTEGTDSFMVLESVQVVEETATRTVPESVQAVEGGSVTEGTAAAVSKQSVEGRLTEKVTAVDGNEAEGGATVAGIATCREEEQNRMQEIQTQTESTEENTSQNDDISEIEADKPDKEDIDVHVEQEVLNDAKKASEDVTVEGPMPHHTAEFTPIAAPGNIITEESVEQLQDTPREVVEVESETSQNVKDRRNTQDVAEECNTAVPDEVKVTECREEVIENKVEQNSVKVEYSEDSAQESEEPTIFKDAAEKETVEAREESQTAGEVTGRKDDAKREESTEVSSLESQERPVTDTTVNVVLNTSVEETLSEIRQTDKPSSVENIEDGGHQVKNSQGVVDEGQRSEVTEDRRKESSEIQGQGDSLENVTKEEKHNLSSQAKLMEEMTAEEIDELEDTYL